MKKLIKKKPGQKRPERQAAMTRKHIIILILLIVLNSCTIIERDKSPDSDSFSGESENRCGDGICDGPENSDLCKEDCLLNTNADSENEIDQKILADEDSVLAQIYFDIQVNRAGGVGDCGQPPWGVDHVDGGDYSCTPPKYWYNYALSATALQNLQLSPSGNDKWTLAGEKSGGGTYQSVSASSDGRRICEPEKIDGNVFEIHTDGYYQDGEVFISLQADPRELTSWECDQGSSYERETTLLLIDWAAAMSGNFTDLSLKLTIEDLVSPGVYQKLITTSMNPSPENRDIVEITIDFTCLDFQSGGVYNSIPCPWE
ncbi:MAG: hypothetical protein Q7J07_08115 [Pelolinea sp.]|nr:hypothetical protein [Pelolinea sp.]